MNALERYIISIADKTGNKKHFVVLHDDFIETMLASTAGSIAVLLNAFSRDFTTTWGWTGFVAAIEPIIDINSYVWIGSLAIIIVIFAIDLGCNLAKISHVNPLSGTIVSLAAFLWN